MTDPLTATIIIVLGKYALDKGAQLAKEVGPAAVEKAAEMFKLALDKLRGDPKGEVLADGFEEDPATYEKPVEKKLDEAIQQDAAFKAKLAALLDQYKAVSIVQSGNTTYQANLTGSGAIAQGPGSTAVGERGVLVGGNVGGPIVTGSGNVIHTGRSATAHNLPPTLASLRDKLMQTFDKRELKLLCFDLGIAHDSLPGETRPELAQALVEHCYERDRLPELLRLAQKERPHIAWGSAADLTAGTS